MLSYDNIRSTIDIIYPGETTNVAMSLKTPDEKGQYYVNIDIVRENNYWFEQKGNKVKQLKLIIK